MNAVKIPPRSAVPVADTWDLSSLCASDDAWEQEFPKWEKQIAGFAQFQGKLGESAATLAAALQYDCDFDRFGDKLGTYAHLRATEDQGNSAAQKMVGRYRSVATRAAEAASYIRPEIMRIDDAKMQQFLASQELAPFKLLVERILRYKPYTLSDGEEKLLAMQGEMAGATSLAAVQLRDVDMKFGHVQNHRGETIELSNATFGTLLHSPKREVRSAAFHQFYAEYDAHKHTLASLLAGSIHKDVYYARARGYSSARQGSLFGDNMPDSVYDNLIEAVHRHLPAVHKYYDVRRRKMGLPDIHHYDTYVPILTELDSHHTWDEAVAVIMESLQPLGAEYCKTLEAGLRGRWCDRYPNQGKQSGAFSSGSYDADPYILMNYQPEVLDHVFTLTHEAGHSMHSHLSRTHQPYHYSQYTIFVAEVASTFNEQLLSRHLLKRAKSDREKAYLINREIDAIRGTIIRQTMFAEFEKITHEMAERGDALTLESFQEVYRGLLQQYFGPDFAIDSELSLECLRIPHFFRAFYVYKYATGLSAAIALSERVLKGGSRELSDYLGFLGAGCSKFPLDLLRDAGVDMESPQPVETALKYFARLVDELDRLI